MESSLSQTDTNDTDKLTAEVLSKTQIVNFYDALEQGSTVRQAAELANLNRRTAYRLLQRYEAKVESAKALLATKAVQAAEDWVRAAQVAGDKGDHRPAKELLQTIGAVQVIGENTGSGVTIIIGTPEQPIRIPAQIIDVSPTEKQD